MNIDENKIKEEQKNSTNKKLEDEEYLKEWKETIKIMEKNPGVMKGRIKTKFGGGKRKRGQPLQRITLVRASRCVLF